MRLFKILLSLSLSIATVVTARAQTSAADSIGPTLTLQQAVAIAIRNNINVEGADITLQNQRVNLNQAWDNMLPTINGSASQSIAYGHALNTFTYTYVNQTQTGSYGLSANLILFQGLQIENIIRANKLMYSANKYDLQWQKDNVTLGVLIDYLLVLSARDQLAISIEQLTSDTVQLHRLENLGAAGNLTTANGGMEALPNLRAQVAQDQINIAQAVNNFELSKITLFGALNVPYRKDVQYENSVTTSNLSDYPTTSDSIYGSALTVVPAVRAAELRELYWGRELSVARGAYYPTLSFGAGISTSYYSLDLAQTTVASVNKGLPTGDYVQGTNTPVLYDQTNYNSQRVSWGDQFTSNKAPSVSLNLSIPILNNLRARNNVKATKISLLNSHYNDINTKLVLQQNVEQAFQNMILAYKQYKFYTDQSADYAETFRIGNVKFTEGLITSDVYIQEKQHADAAAISLAAAKYVYIFRTKVLDYYQGRLAIP
jgi:outer membrane protein